MVCQYSPILELCCRDGQVIRPAAGLLDQRQNVEQPPPMGKRMNRGMSLKDVAVDMRDEYTEILGWTKALFVRRSTGLRASPLKTVSCASQCVGVSKRGGREVSVGSENGAAVTCTSTATAHRSRLIYRAIIARRAQQQEGAAKARIIGRPCHLAGPGW